MMNKRFRVKVLCGVIASALAMSAVVYAQDTTSGVSGRVIDAKGAAVAGAKVKIVHVPSGTTSNATTDANGRFQAQGLRVGGPYHIEAQGGGIKEIDADNVFLNLAETATVNLSETATGAETRLEGVTVTANAAQLAVFNSDNKGLATNISRPQLEAAVNADGSFQNIARLNPRVSITDRDAGAISANGKNFRYNCITVDQVNAGDPFGLAQNGTFNLSSPIPQSAIESYQIATTNFDVSTRGCVGANVNAVSKSGTNDFHGELYYKYRSADSSFMGKITPVGGTTELPFTGWKRDWTGGFNIGGPIIKDTLFFFLSYERESRVGFGKSSTTSDGNDSSVLVNGLDSKFFNSVLTQATAYGMNVGSRDLPNLTTKRYLGKIDWNISDRHRAVFRYNNINEKQPVPTGSATQVTTNSNWYYNNRTTRSYLGQLFSDWTDTFSTELDVQHSHWNALRGPIAGGYQPQVLVSATPTSTSPAVVVGTEQFSQTNLLDIKSNYLYFAGTWHLGEHTVKAGVNANQDELFNEFLNPYYGVYTFLGLAAFQAGNWQQYQLKQPAPGFTLNSAVAKFKKQQYGVFVQDTWQATDRLSLTYGLRYDMPKFPTAPTYNPCFAAAPGVAFSATDSSGKTICTASKGGFGVPNNSTPDGNGAWQPRVSFNYDFDTSYKTQLRGGVGIFTSDIPTVWYSNFYGNNGISTVLYSITNGNTTGTVAPSPVGTLLCSTNGTTFTAAKGSACSAGQISYVKQAPVFGSNPLIPGAGAPIPGSSVAKMQVDTIDPNFKMPNTTQFALAFDRELPWMGIIGTVEFNYTKTNDDVFYKLVNLGAPTYTGPDGRKYYCANTLSCNTNTAVNANPAFTSVGGGASTLLTNTHQGQSSTTVLSLTKPMSDDWSAMVGLRVGHATDASPSTSSQAETNFRSRAWVNPNEDFAATSNYSVPQRVIASLTWQHRFFGDYLTQVTAFADSHSGAPYSWTSGTDTAGEGYAGRELIYIPKSINDVEWTATTSALAKSQLLDYINRNPYLRSHMGQIAGRNAVRSPWINQIDLAFRQQIPAFFPNGAKGELRFDFFNFGNLLNSKWGVEKRVPFPYTRNLANAVGFNPATGKYVFDLNKNFQDANGNYLPGQLQINEANGAGTPLPSQRWSVMMTAKYTF